MMMHILFGLNGGGNQNLIEIASFLVKRISTSRGIFSCVRQIKIKGNTKLFEINGHRDIDVRLYYSALKRVFAEVID